MLLRYFLSFRGRLSLGRYRAFLLWYFLGLVPAFGLVFYGFVTLGWGSSSGLLKDVSMNSVSAALVVYVLGALWPLCAATARRMNDLGYHFKDYFFTVSPKKTFQIGADLLTKPGDEVTNFHGSNPGKFE